MATFAPSLESQTAPVLSAGSHLDSIIETIHRISESGSRSKEIVERLGAFLFESVNANDLSLSLRSAGARDVAQFYGSRQSAADRPLTRQSMFSRAIERLGVTYGYIDLRVTRTRFSHSELSALVEILSELLATVAVRRVSPAA